MAGARLLLRFQFDPRLGQQMGPPAKQVIVQSWTNDRQPRVEERPHYGQIEQWGHGLDKGRQSPILALSKRFDQTLR